MRLVARAMVGKNVSVALAELSFMPQKAAASLKKLIASAYANGRQDDASLTETDFFVKNISVDKGVTYTRYMPRAFGRAAPIHRECSHVAVELGFVDEGKKVKAAPVAEKKAKETKKEEKKVVAKKTTKKKETKEKVTK